MLVRVISRFIACPRDVGHYHNIDDALAVPTARGQATNRDITRTIACVINFITSNIL